MSAHEGEVLLSGATGLVGRALAVRLGHDGWQVRAAVRREASDPGAICVGHIDAATDWRQALHDCVAVVHLAARVHVMRDEATDPLAVFRKVNVKGTLNLARQAAAAGVRRFVFLSSVKVNGEGTAPLVEDAPPTLALPREGGGDLRGVLPHEGGEGASVGRGCFREDDPPAPQDAYAISKWEAEQGLMAIARETGMEVVILRPPLVYGPGVGANFLRLLRLVKRGVPLPFGAIKNRRSLIYLGNLVDAIVLCLSHPAAANQTYLVSDGEDVSTPELIRRLAAQMGKSARLLPVPTALLELGGRLVGRKAEVQRLLGSLVVDSSKIRHELGWQPPYILNEGLEETVRWYRGQKISASC